MDRPTQLVNLTALQAIAVSSGFSHVQEHAVDTLSDILDSYIGVLGRGAQEFAELSNRTQIAPYDVLESLRKYGMSSVHALESEMERDGGQAGVWLQNVARAALRHLVGSKKGPHGKREMRLRPYRETKAIRKYAAQLNKRLAKSGNDRIVDVAELEGEPSSSETPMTLQETLREESFPLPELPTELLPLDAPRTSESGTIKEEEAIVEPIAQSSGQDGEGENHDSDMESAILEQQHDDDTTLYNLIERRRAAKEKKGSLEVPGKRAPSTVTSLADYENTWSVLSEPAESSSLTSREALAFLAQFQSPQYLEPNDMRTVAAAHLMSLLTAPIIPDSLYGNLPVDSVYESHSLSSGYLPENTPLSTISGDRPLYAFGQLPATVTTRVPLHPLPSSRTAAPVPFPRVPDILGDVASLQSAPGNYERPLYSRMARMGPPAPLSQSGKALPYDYPSIPPARRVLSRDKADEDPLDALVTTDQAYLVLNVDVVPREPGEPLSEFKSGVQKSSVLLSEQVQKEADGPSVQVLQEESAPREQNGSQEERAPREQNGSQEGSASREQNGSQEGSAPREQNGSQEERAPHEQNGSLQEDSAPQEESKPADVPMDVDQPNGSHSQHEATSEEPAHAGTPAQADLSEPHS